MHPIRFNICAKFMIYSLRIQKGYSQHDGRSWVVAFPLALPSCFTHCAARISHASFSDAVWTEQFVVFYWRTAMARTHELVRESCLIIAWLLVAWLKKWTVLSLFVMARSVGDKADILLWFVFIPHCLHVKFFNVSFDVNLPSPYECNAESLHNPRSREKPYDI